MVFRFETHLNTPLKSRLSKVTLEMAAKYGLMHDLANSKTHIKSVEQKGDVLIIIKQIETKRGWLYDTFGVPKKGWLEKVTIDRKEKSVAIDAYEQYWCIQSGPYVWKRDMFMVRDDEPGKMTFVRHYFWINQLSKLYAQSLFDLSSWRLRSKVLKYAS